MLRLTRALAFVVIATLLAACGPLTREAHPTTLVNTAWRAVTINGQPLLPEASRRHDSW